MYDSTAGGCLSGFDVSSSRAAGVIVGGRAGSCHRWRSCSRWMARRCRSIVGGSRFLSSLAAVRISSMGGGCLHWLTMAGRSCSRCQQQGAELCTMTARRRVLSLAVVLSMDGTAGAPSLAVVLSMDGAAVSLHRWRSCWFLSSLAAVRISSRGGGGRARQDRRGGRALSMTAAGRRSFAP